MARTVGKKHLYRIQRATYLLDQYEKRLAAKRIVMNRHAPRTSWHTRARREVEAIERRIETLKAEVKETQ